MTINIGVVGCAGRMGREIVKAVMSNNRFVLAGGTESIEEHIGCDIGVLVGSNNFGVSVVKDPNELFEVSDVVIDFTVPEATRIHLMSAQKSQTPMVIGTTGLSQADYDQIKETSRDVPIIRASNFSIGVNVMNAITHNVAQIIDTNYDIEILEMHHRNKIDAPSGTALDLGKYAAAGRNVKLDDVSNFNRNNKIGERKTGEIGFATLRGGDVIGEHKVIFAGESETVELSHKASSRAVFAEGALLASQWVHKKPPGVYSMDDVLSIA